MFLYIFNSIFILIKKNWHKKFDKSKFYLLSFNNQTNMLAKTWTHLIFVRVAEIHCQYWHMWTKSMIKR